jgi:hypothetical protein
VTHSGRRDDIHDYNTTKAAPALADALRVWCCRALLCAICGSLPCPMTPAAGCRSCAACSLCSRSTDARQTLDRCSTDVALHCLVSLSPVPALPFAATKPSARVGRRVSQLAPANAVGLGLGLRWGPAARLPSKSLIVAASLRARNLPFEQICALIAAPNIAPRVLTPQTGSRNGR